MKAYLLILPILFFYSCVNTENVSEETSKAVFTEYNEETLPPLAQTVAIKAAVVKTENTNSTTFQKTNSEVEESIGLPESMTGCADAVIKIVESSPRVQEILSEIKAGGNEPSLLLGDTPQTREGKNEYIVKIGVSTEIHFETITNVVFNTQFLQLREIDWLTGVETVISFDKNLLSKLDTSCY